MLVDKNRFKELKKEAGGISKLECSIVAKILDAPDLKKVDTCSTYVYPNGLYLDFLLSYKLYFPMHEFKRITYDNNTIEVYLVNGEKIRMEIKKEKDLIKFDKVLRSYLGLAVESLNISRSSETTMEDSKTTIKKGRKEREREEYAERMRLVREERKKLGDIQVGGGYYQERDNTARCPKCGSTSITADKKGFSLAKGAAGVFLAGPYGAVAAGHGKNKVIVTCLNCGKQFKPGKGK